MVVILCRFCWWWLILDLLSVLLTSPMTWRRWPTQAYTSYHYTCTCICVHTLVITHAHARTCTHMHAHACTLSIHVMLCASCCTGWSVRAGSCDTETFQCWGEWILSVSAVPAVLRCQWMCLCWGAGLCPPQWAHLSLCTFQLMSHPRLFHCLHCQV